MNNQNNLGGQFTSKPDFGAVYPNTQYKGYYDKEEAPFGVPSAQKPQYNNVQSHGRSQYQGASGQQQQMGQPYGMNQTTTMPTATTPNMGGQQQSPTATGMPGQQQQGGQNSNPKQYSDRDMVNDLLASEKYLTEGYNVSTFEAVEPQLQNTLKNILNQTHSNREQLHSVMQQRGWYKTDPASPQTISQTLNKFSNYKNQLPY